MIWGETQVGMSDEWYTPPYLFDAMQAHFWLDVASPGKYVVPWIPARYVYTHGSLERTWRGFVWMNAPFGGRNGLVPWLSKFLAHGDGVCLVTDRTSAPWWQYFSSRMDATLFVSPKVAFVSGDGRTRGSPAQGTCLMALGDQGRRALLQANQNGLGAIMTHAGDPCGHPVQKNTRTLYRGRLLSIDDIYRDMRRRGTSPDGLTLRLARKRHLALGWSHRRALTTPMAHP